MVTYGLFTVVVSVISEVSLLCNIIRIYTIIWMYQSFTGCVFYGLSTETCVRCGLFTETNSLILSRYENACFTEYFTSRVEYLQAELSKHGIPVIPINTNETVPDQLRKTIGERMGAQRR